MKTECRFQKDVLRACLPFAGIAVALLASGYLSSASAQVVDNDEMTVARRGHTATLLADGRVLLIGGENETGAVSGTEIYDPASGTFSVGPASLVARSEHTATLLPNGRVLVAGGRHDGTSLDSTEILDLALGSFSPGPMPLGHGRAGHSATVLADGTLLIAGGDAEGSAEIHDPILQSAVSLFAALSVPRRLHSAVLLQDGRVLFVGGVGSDGSPLSSAEIFDPETQSFSFVVSRLRVARVRPTLRVLTDGKVQVIGGARDNSIEIFDPRSREFGAYAELLGGSSTASVESILRARTRSALFHNQHSAALVGSFATLLDREGHSLTEIPDRNEALVAGGVNSGDQTLKSAAVLASSGASVTTDWLDYLPGDVVTITGAGWRPTEPVSLVIYENPSTHAELTVTAVADSAGSFTNSAYAPGPDDIGVTFTPTATGELSGFVAQTAFTDGANGAFSVSPDTVLTSSTRTFLLSFLGQNGSTSGDHADNVRCFKATLVGFTLPLTDLRVSTTELQNWTVSASGNTVTAIAVDSTDDQVRKQQTVIVDLTTTAPSTSGTRTWTAQGFNSTDCVSGASGSKNFGVSVLTSSNTKHSATSSPAAIAANTGATYTVTLVNTTTAVTTKAQQVQIALPAGFGFGSLVSATTSNNTSCGGLNGLSWVADGTLYTAGKINLKNSGASGELCANGGTLTVTFTGTSAATAGTYTWVTEMFRGGTTFVPEGAQPTIVVSVCGNGVTEGDEACDGGGCCTASCTFQPSTTVCRGAAGACDVAESCTGTSAACPADGKSTAVCRASAGVCDVAESCNGVGNDCPADGFQSPSTECRPAAGVCDLAESCSGSSAACPGDAKSTAVCRASAGVCDVAESCDGVGNDCPADGFQSASTECRPAAGVCDLAESCTGSSAACPGDAKSTAVCRASAGVCDVAESCNGVGNDCPADGFQSASTECRPAAGVCDLAESCTGSSAACPGDAKSTAVCRASAGVCDVAESCNGVGNDCPADGFQSASTECRPAAGVCDLAESCTGTSAACPADAKSTAVCRASAGVCDVAESCNGASNDCPGDGFQSASTECRPAAGVCDLAESCTGTSAACPADGKSTAGCRASAGVCDVAESCNGVGNDCPVDGFQSASTTCRASAGACDLAENCTGSSAACPGDAKSTAECRASADVCDVAESCNGASNDCPVDGFQSASTTCRASAGACDLAESCTGSSAACPGDAKSTAVCRASAGVCDVAESCDGASNDCPADGFQSASTECRPAAGVCDLAESCTGSSAACPGDAKSVAVCRASAGVCDVAESCDGVGNDCPADGFQSASTECRPAAGVCDLAESCTGSSAACPGDAKSVAVCRASAGVCDVAESCDGASNDCPADGFQSASTECRPAAGVCDLAESCTGSSAACPGDAKSTAVCRASAGVCDVAESCDGASNDCPADGFQSASTECRAAAGVCDLAESCTGSSAACPGDAKSVAVCRASAGVCDVAESCDGASNDCPADGFQSASTECRAAAGVCDLAESCTGSSAACPGDAKSVAVCRASAGVCDVAESCDGVGNDCPADGFQSASTTCATGTSQGGECDDDAADHCSGTTSLCVDVYNASGTFCGDAGAACVNQDTCTGASGTCQDNGFKSAATLCATGTSQGGECDDDAADHCSGTTSLCVDVYKASGTFCGDAGAACVNQDTCTGASGTCQDNGFKSAATLCATGTSQGGECDDDAADHCSGTTSLCVDVYKASGTFCGDAGAACVNQDTCTGASGTCQDNGFKSAGTACGSSNDTDCDNPDSCNGLGICLPNYEPAGLPCTSDGNPCSGDACNATGLCTHPALLDSDGDGVCDGKDCDPLRADNLVVDPGGTLAGIPGVVSYSTLQAAVIAAGDNYVISVYANTTENVVIGASTGSGGDDLRIVGCGHKVTAANVSLPVIKVESSAGRNDGNTGAGERDIHIEDLDVYNGTQGYLVQTSKVGGTGTDTLLKSVRAETNGVGVRVEGNGNEVRGANGINSNGGVGIAVVGSSNVLLSNRVASNTGTAISVQGNSNQLSGNKIGDKDVGNGGYGVDVTGASNTLSDNAIFGNALAGIRLNGTGNQAMKNDVGEDGKGNGAGIVVIGNGNLLGTVTENAVFANSGVGVQVTGNDNQLGKNKVGDGGKGNTGDGINVSGAGNIIQENKVFANGGDGIEVAGGTAAKPNVVYKNTVGDRGKSNLGNGLLLGVDTGNGTTSPVEVDSNVVRANALNGIQVNGTGHQLKNNDSGGKGSYASGGQDNGKCEFLVVTGNWNATGNTANGTAVAGKNNTAFPTACMGTEVP